MHLRHIDPLSLKGLAGENTVSAFPRLKYFLQLATVLSMTRLPALVCPWLRGVRWVPALWSRGEGALCPDQGMQHGEPATCMYSETCSCDHLYPETNLYSETMSQQWLYYTHIHIFLAKTWSLNPGNVYNDTNHLTSWSLMYWRWKGVANSPSTSTEMFTLMCPVTSGPFSVLFSTQQQQ